MVGIDPALEAEMHEAARRVVQETALGSASMDSTGFEFSDSDLQAMAEMGIADAPFNAEISDADMDFLASAGIDSRSLTGDLSTEEQARLEAQDEASAQAARSYFERQDAQAATAAAHQQAAHQRRTTQNLIDEADTEAAKTKKRSQLGLAA